MTLKKKKNENKKYFCFFTDLENGGEKYFFLEVNDLGPCGANDRGGETPGHPLEFIYIVTKHVGCNEFLELDWLPVNIRVEQIKLIFTV